MNNRKKGLSAGSILAICLTICVLVGSIVMLSKMRADNTDARMSAQKVVDMIESVFSEDAHTAVPQNQVRTVTVTLSPPTASQPTEDPAQIVAKTPAPTPTPAPASYSFTMTLSGLVGFHSDISDSVANKGTDFQYQPILSHLSEKLDSDFNVGVLPHIICADDQKYADVLAPVEILDALKTAGFDDLLLNSEHVLDQGVQGIANTVDAIANRGFSCGGVNVGSASQNRILQLNSAKIALLTYTDSLTTKGRNTLATKDGQNIITLFDLDTVQRDIASAKAQGANFIIVFIHWGKEDATAVTKDQREKAQAIADMGGDMIIGFHPSRVLPIEMLESQNEKGEKRQVLVAYSMGTLLTESRDGYDISGILLHLNVTCSSDGKVKFNSIEYTPTYIWRQNFNGNNQYCVVCSADPPEEGMDKNQQEVMGRALLRIQNTLNGCPVTQRE